MKLKEFIKKLKKIEEERGGNIEVVMADYIPVVNPVFVEKDYFNKEVVVITDEESEEEQGD